VRNSDLPKGKIGKLILFVDKVSIKGKYLRGSQRKSNPAGKTGFPQGYRFIPGWESPWQGIRREEESRTLFAV
jgi:hypothetical protein